MDWCAVLYFAIMSEHNLRNTCYLNSEMIPTKSTRNTVFLLSDLSVWNGIT